MPEIIITSSLLILIILALRFLLRGKLSPTVIYALWAVVAVRLLLPVNLVDTPMSVMNLFSREESTQQSASAPVPPADNIYLPMENTENQNSAEAETVPHSPVPEQDATASITAQQKSLSAQSIIIIIWAAGAAATLACTIAGNLRFYLHLRDCRRQINFSRSPLPVYVVNGISSPCLFGLIRPAIYLNEFAAEDDIRTSYIVTHELTHYRHLDHVWAVVRVVCISLHWFNPLVWLAAHLSRQDSELACDRAVIDFIGEDQRFDYGRTLVDMVSIRFTPSNAILTATTMSSSAKSIKQRISMIRVNPTTLAWAAVTAAVVVILAFVVTFTGAADHRGDTVSSSDTLSDTGTSAENALSAEGLPVLLEYFLIEQDSDGLVNPKEIWTINDIAYIMSALDEDNLEKTAPEDIPSDSWIMLNISADHSLNFAITNDGYVKMHDNGGFAAMADIVTIETNNIAAGQYYDGFYGFYRLPDGRLEELLARLSSVSQAHQIVNIDGVGLISENEIDYVTAIIYDSYYPSNHTPTAAYSLVTSDMFHYPLWALHTEEWQQISAGDIPAQTELMLCITKNNFEYYFISTDGYVIWKYLGEKANDAEKVAIDTLHLNFPVSAVYPNGYYGFYKMPDGAAETVLHYVKAAAAALEDAQKAVLQRLVVDLIKSGTCRMDYLDVSIMLDTEEKIDDVLTYISAYNISQREYFDSRTLPEGSIIYDHCVFSQADPEASDADVRIQVNITQPAAYMVIFDGEIFNELELINNASLDALMHYFVTEHIAGGRVYTTHNSTFDALFCSDISVDSQDYLRWGSFAYGGDNFNRVWSLFADINEWEETEVPDESVLNTSRTVSIHNITPYSPPDCEMILYADAGYIKLIFKGSSEWYYVSDGLADRCNEIAALCPDAF